MHRLALTCALAAFAACGAQSSTHAGRKQPSAASRQAAQVRAAAQRYLDALARGDGRAACAMLSDHGIADAGYTSRRDCERDYDTSGELPSWPIVSIEMRTPSEADVIIGDAAASDSGNDALRLKRYPTGWLVDTG